MADTLEALRARRDEAQFELDRMTAGVADRKAEVSTLTKRITALLRAPASAEELPLFDRSAPVDAEAARELAEDVAPLMRMVETVAAETLAEALPDPDPVIDEEPSAIAEIDPLGDPVSAKYTWRGYPVRGLLHPVGRGGLAKKMEAWGLDTFGALSDWLSDGNDLVDLADDPTIGDPLAERPGEPFTLDEVEAIRSCTVKFIELHLLDEEFPPAWVDSSREHFPDDREHTADEVLRQVLRLYTDLVEKAKRGLDDPELDALMKWLASSMLSGTDPKPGYQFRNGRSGPSFWLGWRTANPEGKPAYAGAKLRDKARELLAIPYPASAEEPPAPPEPPRKPSLKKAAKKAKAAPAPDPEPADGLSLFAVRPRQKKIPIYFIKARSLLEASSYHKTQHPKDARHYCYLWEGSLPPNSAVFNARAVNP